MSASLFMKFKNFIARKYDAGLAKMLIHTGVIGWAMSSAAQIAAIAFNDKLSKKQKMFLIPQEFADACVNIASFYLITNSMKGLTSILVKSGKWSTNPIKDFLAKRKITPGMETNVFTVLSQARQTKKTKALLNEFKGFKNGMDVIATTVGSVISCNLVTPLLRNQYASGRQKSSLAKEEKLHKSMEQKPQVALYRPKMSDFSSGSLKI